MWLDVLGQPSHRTYMLEHLQMGLAACMVHNTSMISGWAVVYFKMVQPINPTSAATTIVFMDCSREGASSTFPFKTCLHSEVLCACYVPFEDWRRLSTLLGDVSFTRLVDGLHFLTLAQTVWFGRPLVVGQELNSLEAAPPLPLFFWSFPLSFNCL